MDIQRFSSYAHENLTEDIAVKLTPDERDKQIRRTVIEEIRKFVDENTDNGEAYRADAPEKLHGYLDPDLVSDCRAYVTEQLQDELYDWCVSCCENRLGFDSGFYVDQQIFVRIHTPFDSGMEGTRPTESTPDSPIGMLKWAVQSKLPGLSTPDPSKKALEYNKNRPAPTHSHGPHVDTWYGHSFTATNLWFSVCGVNTSSSMVLYPDKYQKEVPFDPEFMYVSETVDRRNPVEVELEDGENLVFNPELLHSTRLNTSDETRIVITLRVSEQEPQFSNETTHEHTHDEWISSTDIKNGRIEPRTVGQYVDPPKREPVDIAEKITVELDESLAELRQSGTLAERHLPAVDDDLPFEFVLDGQPFVAVRKNDQLYVATSECPHAGFSFERGSVRDSKLKCPEHGAEFDLETGGCEGPECSNLRISTTKLTLE